jgi:tetratricopeptide (TPR) repeat protein
LVFPTSADARGKERSGHAKDATDAKAGKAEADAAEHVRKASEALRARRYDEAMAEFEAGYAIVPKPGFVLNMGHVQREAGNLARARDLYKRYLELEPGSLQRAELEKSIADIDKELAAHSPTAADQPATKPPASPAPPRPSVAQARGEDSEVPSDLKLIAREPIRKPQDSKPQDEGSPFYGRWWFWGTVAGVVAAAAVAFLVLGSRGDDYTTSGTLGTLGR